MKNLRRLIAAGLVIFLFTFSLFLIRSISSTTPDYNTLTSVEGLEEVTIEVPTGASGTEIAAILYEAGVVKSTQAFFRVAVADERSQKVAPGSHRLTLKISAQQALEQLLDPERIPNLIRINEGAWRSEIQEAFLSYGFDRSEINRAFSSLKLPKGFSSSEGLLFPAQYSFPEGTTAAQAAQRLVERFTEDGYAKKLLQGSSQYSPQQLLTIASIIQAEGSTQDFSKVSRVIYNRLKIGMPLQMDSTVHYIMQARGDIFLSRKSTMLNSPYNTYRRYGLPPGPICSPGADAIKAALEPVAGDWLYFITVAPGDTRFTSSLDEFNTWKAIYTKNRKAGAFK
ncbi:MAG: hypothetical protein RLZZ82_325 [Actinomycetota bacterium]